MKKIVLTQGQVALVDDCDFEKLNRFKWSASRHRNVFYATRHSPMINRKRFTIYMHHEVVGKPPKGFMVDHKNGLGTCNIRKNLRFVTHRQNLQNRQKTKNSSRYPGVDWAKTNGKWRAQIGINGKNKYIGLFTDEKKAFEAYKQAVNNLGEKVIRET